jgi:hypothetical protein
VTEVGAVHGVGLSTRPPIHVDSPVVVSGHDVLLVRGGTTNIYLATVAVWWQDTLSGPAVSASPGIKLIVPELVFKSVKIRLLDLLALLFDVEVEQLSCGVVDH